MPSKAPETKLLAGEAYRRSGCATHQKFCDLFGDAVGLRTFRGWLNGEQPATPLAHLMLREFIAGWRPSEIIVRPAK